MTRKQRFNYVIDFFKEHRPVAETELVYGNAYELLVAVILSAQCTDKRINLVTPPFFKRFPEADSLAAASVEEVFTFIKSVSYPNNKAKHLVGMARMLVNDFGNEVPSDINLLQKLPGVGRKTANVISSVIFNQPAMAVDTHVFRVSERLGLTVGARNPLQTELQLIKYIPDELIPKAHHWLILHGRYICVARSPKCPECGLREVCSYYRKLIRKNVVRVMEPANEVH
jgi:endonuclease-3